MIDIHQVFENENVAKSVSLWLDADGDASDLAGAAEYAVNAHIGMLSVAPQNVPVVWPWVEKFNVKIIPRFFVENVLIDTMSGLGMSINSAFKQGADGAQVIVKLNDLEKFTDSLATVRDDLFFKKQLSVGFDVFEIWPLDWENVFAALNKLRATSLLLVLTTDAGDKSDFMGRIYGALENWDAPDAELHIMLGNSFYRAEQVYRLVAKMKPELLDKLRFLVNY